jgi:hypothetical protein
MSVLSNNPGPFTKIELCPNIETIGILVSGQNLPTSASLSYRPLGQEAWRAGHPLMRISDGRLAGSLFGLQEQTEYQLRVSAGSSEIQAQATTQPEALEFMPTKILHVNARAAAGGTGAENAPFRSIQEALNQAEPGTQVLVADGIYSEALTFPRSGLPGQWIQVRAAGNVAVLDSAEWLDPKAWKADGNKIWFNKLGRPLTYLARNRIRFYHYETLSGLRQSRGWGGVSIPEGWFYDPRSGRLYIRSLSDPGKQTWQAPRLNHAFSISGRDWIWIEGFEIRFYGASAGGCGIAATNASHLVIRKNKIHNLQLGIFVNWNGSPGQGNDTRIEENEIFDPPVNEWPWAAVKGSSMEGSGIVLRGHIGAIVRKNEVHHYFNGIYTGSSAALQNPEVALDADIYQNYIHHISDDGLEPEGTCINQRFRSNVLDRVLVGISIAPVTRGPVWALRNIISNFSGTSFKWARDTSGIVLLYHNTCWTNAANISAMSLITPIRNTLLRNNIFQANGYACESNRSGSVNNSWNYNNWYSTRPANSFVFKWENLNYRSLALLCAAIGMECNGHGNPPGLVNPADGDFRLAAGSPNIDRGIPIAGINDDFRGRAPDIGAVEFTPE